MSCVFCEIVAGRIPVEVVAKYPETLAFVPLNPVTPGHVLFVPKIHVEDAIQSPIVTATTFFRAASYAATTQCNLITSAGPWATQTVFHLHVHYVPRSLNDGLHLPWTEGSS